MCPRAALFPVTPLWQQHSGDATWVCECLHMAVAAKNGSDGEWEEPLTGHAVVTAVFLVLLPPSNAIASSYTTPTNRQHPNPTLI